MLIEAIFPAQLGIYKSFLSPAQLSYLDSLSDEHSSVTPSQTIQKDYHGQNVLEHPSLLELKGFIHTSAEHFLVNTFGTTNKLLISNSWINIAPASASQPFHTHSNSLISGTFYISFDSDIHPSLLLGTRDLSAHFLHTKICQ